MAEVGSALNPDRTCLPARSRPVRVEELTGVIVDGGE